jgi:hypothetical protein
MIFDSPQLLGWRHPLMRVDASGLGNRRRGYDPNQPRVPAGHPDGGQWTDDHRPVGLQFAAAERPPIGSRGNFGIALEIARRLIDTFRRQNGQWDLFGHRQGAVTVTTIDGRQSMAQILTSANGGASTVSRPIDFAPSSCRSIRIWTIPTISDACHSMHFITQKRTCSMGRPFSMSHRKTVRRILDQCRERLTGSRWCLGPHRGRHWRGHRVPRTGGRF